MFNSSGALELRGKILDLMKWKLEFPKGRITRYSQMEAVSIEEKMRKATSSKEPIENVAPLAYTEKKDGVLPQYDFRTDRFEIARIAKDKYFAQRQQKIAAELAAAAKQDLKPGEGQ